LRRLAAVARRPKGELASVVVGFNYDLLEANVAERVRSSADRIRERVKKAVEAIHIGFPVCARRGDPTDRGSPVTRSRSKRMPMQRDVDTADYCLPGLVFGAAPPRPWSSRVRVEIGALSHPGHVRPQNEDHFLTVCFGRSLATLQTNLAEGQVPERFA